MEVFSRYRSYTSYSEENGKLIPAKEPEENIVKVVLNDNLVLVPLEQGKKILEEYEKKLKSEAPKEIVKPSTNDSTK
jgi:hypothetical protein